VQYYCYAERLFLVPPGAFSPPPKVDSAVVRLTPYRKRPYEVADFVLFRDIVREAFNKRRKTLANSLKGLVSAEQLIAAGISPQARAETLSVKDFVAITNALR